MKTLRRLLLLFPILASHAGAAPVSPPPTKHQGSGRKVIAATAHPLATQAALNAFRRGGNAVDAAVAAGLTLGVVDGHNSGIGGGCFMLIRLPDGSVKAFDGREMAPARAHRDMFVRNGRVESEWSKVGPLASGIPGSLAVYDHVLNRFGRLRLADLLLPAAEIAESGFPIDAVWARKLRAVVGYVKRYPYSASILLRPDGSAMEAGDVIVQRDLARTYRAIAHEGIGWFYGGDFARRTEAWMRAHGGIITARDFADYRMKERQPVTSRYRGHTVYGFPPPSSGGVHVAQVLNMLEAFAVDGLNRPDRMHLFIEAEKRAFADRAYWLGDPDFVKVPRGLMDRAYPRRLAGGISLNAAGKVSSHGQPPAAESDVFEKHTTHFTTADAEGYWVACTATVNTGFGSKVIIPGTGVILNNQMDDFSARPGVPNAFGLIGAEANAIAPGKRPLSSMSPTIITRDGQPVLTVGAAGGPTIITQALLAIVRRIDLGLPLRDCLAWPRYHHQWFPDQVRIEGTAGYEIRLELERRGHQLDVRPAPFGASQAIARDADGRFEAVSDPRIFGRADGF